MENTNAAPLRERLDTELEDRIRQLEELPGRIAHSVNSASRIKERLTGPTPKVAGGDQGLAPHNPERGLLERMDSALSEARERLTWLEDRLEELSGNV